MSPPTGPPPPTALVGDPRSLPRLLAGAGGPGLDAHFRRWGPRPDGGPMLIDEVEQAGLARGGAGFPTTTKLRAVAAARRSIVVANGTEGEPASGKDKALLAGWPHLILDGISLAAECVGAGQAIICIDRNATAAINSVTAALAERDRAAPDRVPIRVETTPTGYLTGEESALVRWLNGGEAKPTFVPPRPVERGVGGRPTLVNNVETLAQLAVIARLGAAWYRSLGTVDDPGTALVTVSGDVARPGVYEVPLGVPLTTVLGAARATPEPQAVLIGGYCGVWIPGEVATKVSLDSASLGRLDASLGCGAISVIGPARCGLWEVAAITAWMAGQSAAQCGPCLNGPPSIATALDALAAGGRGHRWEKQLRRWLDLIEGRGACHHPDGTARMVRSALRTFAGEIDNHRRHAACAARPTVLPIPDVGGSWR